MSRTAFVNRLLLRVSVILLPVSIALVAVAVTLLMLTDVTIPRLSISLIALFSAALLWWAGILIQIRTRFFFASVFLFLTGILFFILDFQLLHVPSRAVWPLEMLFIGCAFVVSGFIQYGRFHVIYMAPAIVFSALGFLFLLFSTEVISVSFASVVLWWFPILLIPSLASLFIWIFRRGKADEADNE